jgi:hypothetical protein
VDWHPEAGGGGYWTQEEVTMTDPAVLRRLVEQWREEAAHQWADQTPLWRAYRETRAGALLKCADDLDAALALSVDPPPPTTYCPFDGNLRPCPHHDPVPGGV